MFPRLLIDRGKIRSNIEKLVDMFKKHDLTMVGVTKLFTGDPRVAKLFKDTGVDILADSRMENILRMRRGGIEGPFMMIRIPPPSRLEEILEHVDFLLVSEPSIVEMIDEIARKEVKLYYMVDVGDLREGVMFDRAVEEIAPLMKLKRARIVGVGTNVGCFGGVLPSRENLEWLVGVARELGVSEISVGGTVYLLALEGGFLPRDITNIRIGEAALLGTDATGNRDIPYLEQGTVILEAEVVEVKVKPSVPVGERGRDSMGGVPEFEDRGFRKRAILAIGVQDVDPKGLKPLDNGAVVVHASSDHLIVDVEDVDREIGIGSVMSFRTNYSATLRAVTSPYVEKVFLS